MAKYTLNIGQELHSDTLIYRIESVLGQGSFGITYKAKAFTVIKGKFGEELVETNTPKAIKEFFMKEVNEREESGSITRMSEGGLSYNYAQKFKKEAENLASMNHPNIVKVIDFISANNTYYYVMDFIEGENLNDYLKNNKMSEKEATDTIMEVAKALKYMHEKKHMLHLDLKPGNIMRRESDGHIFLIDFGLSKHYSEDGIPETSTNVGLGTAGYAPIEQANSKNGNKFRETLDVYALGATFFKLLTGHTPPSADELVSDGNIVKDELSHFGINETLTLVIVNAMNPSFKERTQNVEGFIASLNHKDAKAGITFDAAENEVTILDTHKKYTIKKKTEDKPEKESESINEVSTMPQEVEPISNDKSENANSSNGCLKTILGVTALCIFILWYNDMWFFTPKEVIANETPSKQVDSNVDDSNDNNSVNAVISTDSINKPIEHDDSNIGTSVHTEDRTIEDNIQNGKLYYPDSPTSINTKERTIRDLLYFPYGCLPKEIDSKDKAQRALSSNFGSYEIINQLMVGLHRNVKFNFTYKGVPIGISYVGWTDNKHWYRFYLNTKKEAEAFYSKIVQEIKDAGIPLKIDKVYGGMSSRNRPVSIFKWIYVNPPEQIKEGDICCNLNKLEHVGKYMVELGVYKREKSKNM